MPPSFHACLPSCLCCDKQPRRETANWSPPPPPAGGFQVTPSGDAQAWGDHFASLLEKHAALQSRRCKALADSAMEVDTASSSGPGSRDALHNDVLRDYAGDVSAACCAFYSSNGERQPGRARHGALWDLVACLWGRCPSELQA